MDDQGATLAAGAVLHDRSEVGRPAHAVHRGQHRTGTSRPAQADSSLRPLRRRAAMIARPARVRIRSRKPCVFARRRLFGWKVRLLTVGLHQSFLGRRARGHVGVTCNASGGGWANEQRQIPTRLLKRTNGTDRAGGWSNSELTGGPSRTEPAKLRRTSSNVRTTRRCLLSASARAVRFPHRVTPRRDTGLAPQGSIGVTPYTVCGQVCGRCDLYRPMRKSRGACLPNRTAIPPQARTGSDTRERQLE